MFLDLFIAASYTSCLEMPEKCIHQHVSGMPFNVILYCSVLKSCFSLVSIVRKYKVDFLFLSS